MSLSGVRVRRGAADYARGVLTARGARVYARALLLEYARALRYDVAPRAGAERADAYLARRAPFEVAPND